jgi:hypothetical protein
LSGNLIVQLGLVTEALNRHWYERNTGQTIECVQHRLRHPVLRWIICFSAVASSENDRGSEAEFMRKPPRCPRRCRQGSPPIQHNSA